MTTLYIATAAATLMAGYALGRWRPWHHAREWALGAVLFLSPGRALKARLLLALAIQADQYLKARLNPPSSRTRQPAPALVVRRPKTDTEGAP